MKSHLAIILTCMWTQKRIARFGLLGDGFVALFMVVFLNLGTALTCSAQVQQAWVARYNNGITNGTNQALKMVLDSNGNAIVTGVSQNTNNQLGYVTIKYAPNGNQIWASRYDSTNYPTATPTGVVVDSSNNAVVIGTAIILKYDSNGDQVWTAPYSGNAIAIDTGGNVVVTGVGSNFTTAKLNPMASNLWQTSYSDPVGPAVSQIVLVDKASNAYVAGPETYATEPHSDQLRIIKYDQYGNQLWSETYGPAYSVIVGGGAIDSSNNVYLITCLYGTGAGYETLKYDSEGTLAWNVSPNNNVNSQAQGLVLDHKGNVIVTGMAKYFSFYFQYGTFGINANGSPIWTNYYPQPAGGLNVATSIAVDGANNTYTTGYSSGVSGTNNIVTIKYGPNGNQMWIQSYNGLNAGNDAGNTVAVDKSGNVYVTGYETLPGGGTGIVTIKYIPISIKRQTNGTVLIETQGTPGESFDIQASSDLLNWLDLGSVLADTNGLMQFDDTNAPNFPARFYYTNPR